VCTSLKGTAGELLLMSQLIGQGIHVFWNVARQGPADLIAWRPGGVPVPLDVKVRVGLPAKSISDDGVHVAAVDGLTILLTPEAQQLLGL
jgi:hypothetical protein